MLCITGIQLSADIIQRLYKVLHHRIDGYIQTLSTLKPHKPETTLSLCWIAETTHALSSEPYNHFYIYMVKKTESGVCQNIVYFPKDSILMRLRVFHFMSPYTCSVFRNLKLCTVIESLVTIVQSSAYLSVLTLACSGTLSSISLICMLNKVGEMADPWGTPAGHGVIKDSALWMFICYVLPSKNSLSIARCSLLRSYRQAYPRADGAMRRARVLILPGYLHPGKRKH